MAIVDPIVINFFRNPVLNRIPEIFDVPEDEIVATSQLGSPVYSNLVFEPEDSDLPRVVLNDVIITVTQSKNIVTTSVAGRSGTIKEYISDGDYLINVRGLLVEENTRVAPYNDLSALLEWLKVQAEIDVVSKFLDLFGITTVVVTNYTFNEAEGFRNVIPLNIEMLSERPIEIRIDE